MSWVKNELSRWGANSDFDNWKLLQPGRGERKHDTGLRKVFIDFLIYEAVVEKRKQGHLLTPNKEADGVFIALEKTKFAGVSFSPEHIRDRYYRFINHKAVMFIDDGKKMILGPGRVTFEVNGKKVSMIGFTEYEPKDGFELIK